MRPAIGLAAAVLALAACSSGGGGGFGSPQPPSVTGSGAPATTTPASPSAAARLVLVEAPGQRFEPAEIGLRHGDPVILELRNTDSAAHTLTVNELSLFMRAEPGETVRLPFTPSEAGAFAMFCSIPGHRAAGHEGLLRVT